MREFLSYRNQLPAFKWPKIPPTLTAPQQRAREEYMMLWHREVLGKYRAIEAFNHGYVASLPVRPGSRTLEIGAGLGAHVAYENLVVQEYHALEYRAQFCEEIRKVLPAAQVRRGDIQTRQDWPDGSFDRIVAIHVLEHLPHLPAAIGEIQRLLAPDGVIDVVIPCEGGLAHTLARKVSAERLFRQRFGMEFLPIHLNEHVNSYNEVVALLKRHFAPTHRRFFPLRLPIANLNLCSGFRFLRRPAVQPVANPTP